MVQSQVKLDRIYSALSDSSRRAIIARLVQGPASVSALAEPLRMSLTAAAKHVAVLERSGIVISFKAGRVRTCRIDPKKLDVAQEWLSKQRALWEARFDRLDRLLENQPKE